MSTGDGTWVFKFDPARVELERYRTSAGLYTEAPGSYTDRARAAHWAEQSMIARDVAAARRHEREQHEIEQARSQREHTRRTRNKQYKARTQQSGPNSLERGT